MMSDYQISLRNLKLIKVVEALGLGLHVLNLPHRPMFISYDYKYKLNVYVQNYDLILLSVGDDIFHTEKIKELHNMDIESLRSKFVEMMTMYEQKRIWVLTQGDLFLTGFNHHNKIDKTRPYPVFAKYEPIIYNEYDKAFNTANKYNLKIIE